MNSQTILRAVMIAPHFRELQMLAQEAGLGGTGFSLWGLVEAGRKPHRINRLRKKCLILSF
jgi:hypothetical protein